MADVSPLPPSAATAPAVDLDIDADAPLPAAAREVLDFWFGAPGDPEHLHPREVWFRKDDAFDAEIRGRFGALIDETIAGAHDDWIAPKAALARIVVLDQFTRNVFRGTARAFAGDAQALAAARALTADGIDRTLAPVERQFVYLPFEHSESDADQRTSLRLFGALAEEHPEHVATLDYARRHAEIVERFGRFPHRNAALGRASTPDEVEFLKTPGSGF